MGDKSLIQQLRDYGEDPGPISDANRAYWKRTLQQLKRRPVKGSSEISPAYNRPRNREVIFSSDDDDDVDRGSRNRLLQYRSRNRVKKSEEFEVPMKRKVGITRNARGAAVLPVATPRVLHIVCACLGIAVIAGYFVVANLQEARTATELRRLDSK